MSACVKRYRISCHPLNPFLMQMVPFFVAFLAMVGVVITLAATEKWKKELMQQLDQAERQHDNGC